MKLPAWPSHVEKNDDWIYIGTGRTGGLSLNGSLAIGLFASEQVINTNYASKNLVGSSTSLHYFVKKGEPFLARFAPQKPADLPLLPEGTVYIGRGGTDSHPSWTYNNGNNKYLLSNIYCCGGVFGKAWSLFKDCWSSVSDNYIATEIDSPLHKAQPWYVPNTKVKPVIKVENKPNITPLPAHIKVPEGYVYCGKGNEVKVPSGFNMWNCPCRYDDGNSWHDGGNVFAQAGRLYYFFPIGSEIAIFNGHTIKKRRETLKEKDARIEALNKENAALKEQVAKYEGWIKSAPKV